MAPVLADGSTRRAKGEEEKGDRNAFVAIVLVIVTAPAAVRIATDLSLLAILLIGLAFAALVLPVIWVLNRRGS